MDNARFVQVARTIDKGGEHNFQGPALAVEAMVAWAKGGPPGSTVTSVEETAEAGPLEPGFVQRPTE